MEKVIEIIQRNTEIVKRIKEHIDIVNLQFLEAHIYIERKMWSTRQDPPQNYYYNAILFDSYAKKLLRIVEGSGVQHGPYILNTELMDWYLFRELGGRDVESTEKYKKLVLESYSRDNHIYTLVGRHCLSSVWNEELTFDEKEKAQNALILDVKNLLNFNLESLKEFDVVINNLTFSCEIVKLGEIKLKRKIFLGGDNVTYHDNDTSITKKKKIDIPYNIAWMSISWEIVDIADGFFNNCYEAESITLPDDLHTFNWSFWNCHKLKEINTKTRNKSKYDKRKCFSHDGVLFRFIGDGMANECELIAYPNMHAKEYQIPEIIEFEHRQRIVVSISKFAFKDCDNLETLLIPKSIKSIGCNAFYRCNNLRTVYYFGIFENLRIEGFYGAYGSVNPTWLCKTTIPSLQPKINIIFTEDENKRGILRFKIGGIDFNMIRFKTYGDSSCFIGETTVTRALWKIIMSDYPEGQYNEQFSIFVTYLETQDFLIKLNELTRMPFQLPTPELWLSAAEGGGKLDFKSIKVIPKYHEYQVKSFRTNDLGIYDMFGPGELCIRKDCMDAPRIRSRNVPLMGCEILGEVSDEIGIADFEKEKHTFRLFLSLKNTSWKDNEFYNSEQ